MATAWRSQSAYFQSSAGPLFFRCLAFKASAYSTVSRPSRIATMRASFTTSLIVAPVAYGDISASFSTSSGVSECFTLSR